MKNDAYYWQKNVYLDAKQAQLLAEIIDRITRQMTLTHDKRKSPVGPIYMEDYRIDLNDYNLLVAVYDDLLANKNIVYEESGMLHYVNSAGPSDPSKDRDIGLDERQLELLSEILKTFLSQNNGVGDCKLDLGHVETDYEDYRRMKSILDGLSPS